MNTREVLQALLDGKKLMCKEWSDSNLYVSLVDNKLMRNEVSPVSLYLFDGGDWKEYKAPTPRVKIENTATEVEVILNCSEEFKALAPKRCTDLDGNQCLRCPAYKLMDNSFCDFEKSAVIEFTFLR